MASFNLDAARERMFRKHLRARGIRDPRVLTAMARVPRERFVGAAVQNLAYADQALGIECGQTISQPYIVALMSQALELDGTERVLEVGTGSGYQTAVLAELAREVVTIERHGQLSATAGLRLDKLGYGNVKLIVGDGTLGWPDEAPYDRIIVTAAAARCPLALLDQQADGGVLVIPVGGSECQVLQAFHKVGDNIESANLTACRFVPLIGAQD